MVQEPHPMDMLGPIASRRRTLFSALCAVNVKTNGMLVLIIPIIEMIRTDDFAPPSGTENGGFSMA